MPDTTMTDAELDALLSCPFCGGEAKLIRPMGDRIYSDSPPYYGPPRYRYTCAGDTCFCMTWAWPTEPEARQQWNTRSDAAPALHEALLPGGVGDH